LSTNDANHRGSDNLQSDYNTEWTKSIEVVDKFDKTLTELRLKGFAIITGLTGLSTFFGLGLTFQNGIIHATLILVIALFWLDLYYQNVLVGALLRSIFLELFRVKKGMVYFISSIYDKARLHRYTNIAYVGFFLSVAMLGYVINLDQDNSDKILKTISQELSEKEKIDDSKTLQIITDIIKNIKNNQSSHQSSELGFFSIFLQIPDQVNSSNITKMGLLFFIAESISVIYLWWLSYRRTSTYFKILNIYNYFNRLNIHDQKAIDKIEHIILRILNDYLEREGKFDKDEQIEYSDFNGQNCNVDLKSKIYVTVFRGKDDKIWRRDKSISIWIIASKEGVLLVQPNSIKNTVFIAKNDRNFENISDGIFEGGTKVREDSNEMMQQIKKLSSPNHKDLIYEINIALKKLQYRS
jgi:hypothetical protein